MFNSICKMLRAWADKQYNCLIEKDLDGLWYARELGNKYRPGRVSNRRHCTPGGAALEAKERGWKPKEVTECYQ
jgi:hypothetical protein